MGDLPDTHPMKRRAPDGSINLEKDSRLLKQGRPDSLERNGDFSPLPGEGADAHPSQDEELYCYQQAHRCRLDDCGSYACTLRELTWNEWLGDVDPCEYCQIAEDTYNKLDYDLEDLEIDEYMEDE